MSDHQGKILYCLHWFPALSETFILRELIEMQNQGQEIDICAFNPPPDEISHPDVEKFKGRLYEDTYGFFKGLNAHLYWLTSYPEVYLPVLWHIITKIYHLKTFTVSLRMFWKAVSQAHRFRESGYFHIHAHFGNAPATAAWIMGKLLKIPMSFTLHGVGVFSPDRLLPRKVSDSKFTAIISNYNIKHLKKRFPQIDEDKFHVVRCGVNPDGFTFKKTTEITGIPQILSVGRMVETKGFKYLIDAVKILTGSGKKLHLRIIGGGDLLEVHKKQVSELGLDDIVTFTGPVTQDQVYSSMMESDLFVLAACESSEGDMEGIPVVLMESLAFGIPTISTEFTGIPELVMNFDTGLLVPPADSKSLADAMLLYLSETDLRSRLPSKGRRLVEEHFNVKKSVTALINLIRK